PLPLLVVDGMALLQVDHQDAVGERQRLGHFHAVRQGQERREGREDRHQEGLRSRSIALPPLRVTRFRFPCPFHPRFSYQSMESREDHRMLRLAALAVALVSVAARPDDNLWLVFEGGDGPGKGKHIVLLSGDKEYRSEETMPQLGKILSKHHG